MTYADFILHSLKTEEELDRDIEEDARELSDNEYSYA